MSTDLTSYTVCNRTVNINKKEEITGVTKFLSPPQQCALVAHFIGSKPPTFTLLVVGSSDAGKSNFRKCINHMQHHRADCHNLDEIKIHDSNDCVVDYDTHSIRYIYKNKLAIEESEIHGIMIVIENNTSEWSLTADNHIRDTFSQLPRRAVKNCCIVNMFKSTTTFGFNDAEQQMRAFVTTFRNQHELMDGPSFVCVDIEAMQVVLDCNTTDSSNVCQELFEASNRDIEKFLETVQIVQPVTPTDLKTAETWKRLCEAFRPLRQHQDPETLRLMATIAENCLTGVAIYCRKNLPLRNNEWPAAVDHWNLKDEKVAAALRRLEL